MHMHKGLFHSIFYLGLYPLHNMTTISGLLSEAQKYDQTTTAQSEGRTFQLFKQPICGRHVAKLGLTSSRPT